nr:VapE domain-containing protein [uncultured Bacteroides sp.]
MQDITVSAYRGFSRVEDETNLSTLISNIRGGTYFRLVRRVEEQFLLGNVSKANDIKRQIPFFTLTGNYSSVRQPYSLVRYNPVVTIDVDDLADDLVEPVRGKLESCPDVVASFLTPKRHGFKIFLYLQSDYACNLRRTVFSVPAIGYPELERHHALMYESARMYVEGLIGVPVDTSGKDISRGFFASFDPRAYLNEELMRRIDDISTKVIVPEKGAKAVIAKATSAKVGANAAGGETTGGGVAPWHEMEYKKALGTTRRSEKFREGNRDNFLFTLGNRCFRKGIDEEVAVKLACRDFHQADLDVEGAIRNAYTYVSKTEAAEKAGKTPVINRVMDFLSTHYEFRRNTVLDRLEIKDLQASECPSSCVFRPLRAKDMNSIYVGMLTDGINCSLNSLRAIVDSGYVKDYDPFSAYIGSLPPWDGTTDYIGELAGTVRTEDDKFWQESFRRWLVGSLACALYPRKVNQLVLLLFGEQGIGKSSWINRLLPPVWHEYCHTGMVNPDNRDDMLLLSTRYLINLDEFQGVRPSDLAGLKRMITQDAVIQRKVYDTQAFSFIRRASFIASTNKRRCLQDIDGGRRFLPSSVLSVDYIRPVDYSGVYSQAFALLNSGFRYWYEGDEIGGLNVHNEHHRLQDPVEENLFVFFRRALPGDLSAKWMPASALLAKLSMFGRIQVTRQTQQELVQALEKYGFKTRTNGQGGTEYEVVEFQAAEVEDNFKRRLPQ